MANRAMGRFFTLIVMGLAVGGQAQTTKPAEEKSAPVSTSDERSGQELLSFRDVLKRDIKELPRSLWDDTKAVYTRPLNLGILLVAGGATLAVRNTEVDDRWEHHFDKHRSFSEGWGDTAGVVGNPLTHLGIGLALYAYGANTGGEGKTYEFSKALLNALIINDLSTVALKTAACTESPNGEDWAWPSGHTSSSFAVAAVVDKYYGHWAGFPLYGMAAFVGFERMDDREHYFSDVLFGAALGYVIGSSVANNHYPHLLGGQVVPYVDPYRGQTGVAWVKEF